MTPYTTLPEMLAWRARETPEVTAFTFGDIAPTFVELWREVDCFAALLAGLGIGRGERVLLALPNGPEFFAVFYGIQRAGAAAVPIFPDSGADRIADLTRLSGSRAVVLQDGLDPAVIDGVRDRLDAAGTELLTPAAAEGVEPIAELRGPAAEDVAYIQYTSGSTGDPKGVQPSHFNLLTNVRQMIVGMEITAEDVFVTWLPTFHDMGLVISTMAPFSIAAELVVLPTSLRNIDHWLGAIESHCGTFTAAPDFAYRLCLRAAGRHDLSSLRVALNAAEPVRASTLARFEEAFGLDNIMMPAYGLAEATVGVSMWPPGTEVKIDERGFPSVGSGFPDVELRILGEEGLVDTGEVGEILVQSPANTGGYLGDPEATRALFHGDLLRTGDLGYLDADGDLFIVGRQKNIIIHAGRNLAPSEIEQAADEPREVRLAAAVGVDRGDEAGEQVYVFAEARNGDSLSESDRRALATDIVRRVHERLGVRPGRVYLLRPRSIPLTANGKVRHQVLKAAYLDGSLREAGAVLFPGW